MPDPIDINSRKPHTAGNIICMAPGCGHMWVGVVPTGVACVECPECHAFKGFRRELILPTEETPTYRCHVCQSDDGANDVFTLTPFYVMCMGCGHKHTWDEVMPGTGW